MKIGEWEKKRKEKRDGVQRTVFQRERQGLISLVGRGSAEPCIAGKFGIVAKGEVASN